jgi:hypothetical protein
MLPRNLKDVYIRMKQLFAVAALLFTFLLGALATASAQTTSSLHGQVADPTGAIIPGASITLSGVGKPVTAQSDSGGNYSFRGIAPGNYTVTTTVAGFTPFSKSGISIASGQSRLFNVTLAIATQDQKVTVSADEQSVDTSSENNANQIVIKGKDLDALSDDPDQLSDELQALAGPAAGPSGGQIYIDGFTGGQLPPKSSIREIRVNQNPFSAEFDRLGYGRIEILTKPGSDKLHGQFQVNGNDSSFNAPNPILNANTPAGEPVIQEPAYYSDSFQGGVGGPLSKTASYNVNFFVRQNHGVNIVDTLVPDPTNNYTNADGSVNVAGIFSNAAYTSPSSRYDFQPRFDFAFGANNTLTVSYEYYRSAQSNAGIGENSLPSQAYSSRNEENTFTLSDTQVLSKSIVNDTRFRYRRIRGFQNADSSAPSVSVQGALETGGNGTQTVQDHQGQYEFQDYATASHGNHAIHFGTRLRAYSDVNLSESGTNGAYTFTSLGAYIITLRDTALGETQAQILADGGGASQYSVTNVNKSTASATLFDAALYYQDDWKVSDKFTFAYGLRYEAQNFIHDKADFGPRFSIAYAVARGKEKPKTVIRAGYGWFFQRFTVPGSFSSNAGTPYIVNAIHQNDPFLGTPNQQGLTANSPTFLLADPTDPSSPALKQPASALAASNTLPSYYTVDPHFHAAIDMQSAIGVDHQFGKSTTSNVTYLYAQGVHQFLTNNVTAPILDLDTYTTTANPDVATPQNNYQYQSEGIYRQNQLIVSANTRLKRVSLFGNYSVNLLAKGDTDGVTSTPSDPHDLGLDYGRTPYANRQRGVIFGNLTGPYAISFAPFLSFNAGSPFNITTGENTSENNQFNFRPTFASVSGADCTAANNATETPYGCLDLGTVAGHKLIPFDAGTSPTSVSLNARMSKVIGFGPKVRGGGPGGGGGGRGPGGGLGGRGFSGNSGGPGRLDAAVPRKYNVTLSAFTTNVLNHENLGTPSGVELTRDTGGAATRSNLFLKSQSLAGGFFGPSTAGNRSIFLSAVFNF